PETADFRAGLNDSSPHYWPRTDLSALLVRGYGGELSGSFQEQYGSVEVFNKRGAFPAVFEFYREGNFFIRGQGGSSDELNPCNGNEGSFTLIERPCLYSPNDTQNGGKFFNGAEIVKPSYW